MTKQEFFTNLEGRIGHELGGMRDKSDKRDKRLRTWCSDGFVHESFVFTATSSGARMGGQVWTLYPGDCLHFVLILKNV